MSHFNKTAENGKMGIPLQFPSQNEAEKQGKLIITKRIFSATLRNCPFVLRYFAADSLEKLDKPCGFIYRVNP